MVFDCLCASVKCSVNASTTSPNKTVGLTGVSRSNALLEFFKSVSVSQRGQSSTTKLPIVWSIEWAVIFVALSVSSAELLEDFQVHFFQHLCMIHLQGQLSYRGLRLRGQLQ